MAWTSLRAVSLKPRDSNLLMMLPTSPRWTPSGWGDTAMERDRRTISDARGDVHSEQDAP